MGRQAKWQRETFHATAVVDRDGVVVRANDWHVNNQYKAVGVPYESPHEIADHVAAWFPTGPDQTVHIWFGGGVGFEGQHRTTLDGLPPADVTAESTVPVGGVR